MFRPGHFELAVFLVSPALAGAGLLAFAGPEKHLHPRKSYSTWNAFGITALSMSGVWSGVSNADAERKWTRQIHLQ